MKNSIKRILLQAAAGAFMILIGQNVGAAENYKDIMHKFAETLEHVQAFDKSQAKNNVSDDELKKAVTEMNSKVQTLKDSDLPKGEGYKISLKALQRHLGETERMVRLGQTQYARWMLNATTTVCVACHTQMPSGSAKALPFEKKDVKLSVPEQYSKAEYLFTTRQFDRAHEAFQSLINGYPKNGLNTVSLDTSLRREVSYFARIKGDPKAAVSTLDKYRENKELPEAIHDNLQAWAALFRSWSREAGVVPTAPKDIVKFANKKFKKTLWDRMIPANDPRVVDYLRVSGLIYKELFSSPESSETPELLLILGRCENALNENFIYSLGDLYFRECIEKFPKSNAAKQCLSEYELSLTKSYTTTTGLEMPPELSQELKVLRKLIGVDK